MTATVMWSRPRPRIAAKTALLVRHDAGSPQVTFVEDGMQGRPRQSFATENLMRLNPGDSCA